MTQITTQHHLSADPNGNHDSGYVPSNVTDVNDILVVSNSPPGSPEHKATIFVNKNATNRRNGSPRKEYRWDWKDRIVLKKIFLNYIKTFVIYIEINSIFTVMLHLSQ